MSAYWPDTDIALRFLTGDLAALAEKARGIFRGAEEGRWQLVIHPLVVAEIVYALLRLYELPKSKVVGALRALLTLPGVRVIERSAVMGALEHMEKSRLGCTDAFHVEKARATSTPVATSDADLMQTGFAELP